MSAGAHWRTAVSAGLALAVLLAVAGIAQPHSSHRTAKARAPLRVLFYVTAPVRVGPPAVRPRPRSSLDASVKRHLAALKWARATLRPSPWSRPGSPADRKLGAILAAIASTHAHVRGAALMERPQGSEQARSRRLRVARTGFRLSAHRLETRRLRRTGRSRTAQLHQRRAAGASAARTFWLAQATFPGYGLCRGAPTPGSATQPDARSARASGTYLIRPGSGRAARKRLTLSTDRRARGRARSQRMNASGARRPARRLAQRLGARHGHRGEPRRGRRTAASGATWTPFTRMPPGAAARDRRAQRQLAGRSRA